MTEQVERPTEPARQNALIAILSTLAVAVWLGWSAGWIWALAGVVGIFVHEFGHALAINRAGCGPSRIYFVPFLGGLATQPRPSPNAITDVVISISGPALGITAIAPFFAIHAFTGDDRWIEGAFFIAAINLLNLFPAPPLDGSKALGPVLAKVHPMLERAVAIVLAGVAVLWALERGSYVFGGLIALGAAPILMGRPIRRTDHVLSDQDAWQAAGLYIATAVLCVLAIVAVGMVLGTDNPFELLQRLVGR